MLKENFAIVKWNSRNKTLYTSKGYIYTKMGEEFKADINDLTQSSKGMVTVVCDYCGAEIIKPYQLYLKQHHQKHGDACVKCQPKKNKLIVQEKYGVDNVGQVEEFKKKAKQTSMEHYGADNPSKSKEVVDKIKETNLRKYGVESTAMVPEFIEKRIHTCLENFGCENPFASKEIQQKIYQTNLERYGCEHSAQNLEVQNKVRKTNLEKFGKEYYSQTGEYKKHLKELCYEKYGYSHMLKSPDVRAKIANTMAKNGTCPTSKQQIKLKEILEELYGNCEMNKPCGQNLLDCVVEVEGILIDVEYDGWYWHQDTQRDRRRDEFVKSQGYKVLRIVGNKKVPNKEELIAKIKELTSTNKKFAKISMV